MERQNVTLSLPKPILKKAKTLAAMKEKSLSELMRDALEEKIKGETGYQRAKERHKKILMTGFNLGTKGHLKISREELHERK